MNRTLIFCKADLKKLKTFVFLVHFLFLNFNILTFKAYAQKAPTCSEFLDSDLLYYTTTKYEALVPQVIPANSWAADFAYLSVNQHLISQTDPKLKALGLVLPEEEKGGICGPTCVGNIAASLDFHTSQRRSLYWVNNVDVFIDGLIRKYQEIALQYNDPTGHNPLLGTFTHFFASEYNEKNIEMGVKAEHFSDANPLRLMIQVKKSNKLIVGTVTFHQDKTAHARHAIVILGINLSKKQLLIVDPNDPHKILVTSYLVLNDKMYFSLNEDLYGTDGQSDVHLDEILSFESLR